MFRRRTVLLLRRAAEIMNNSAPPRRRPAGSGVLSVDSHGWKAPLLGRRSRRRRRRAVDRNEPTARQNREFLAGRSASYRRYGDDARRRGGTRGRSSFVPSGERLESFFFSSVQFYFKNKQPNRCKLYRNIKYIHM